MRLGYRWDVSTNRKSGRGAKPVGCKEESGAKWEREFVWEREGEKEKDIFLF